MNHGRKCMQELDSFSHSMGWIFKVPGESRHNDSYTPRDSTELSHSAFGTAVEIPIDFVSPRPANSKAKAQKKKSTSNHLHHKRATGLTASSSTKTFPTSDISSQSSLGNVGNIANDPPQRPPRRRPRKRSSKSEKPKGKAVDFVYDIDVRQKLRDQLDDERSWLLQETKAREARLRAEHKWVFDKNDKIPPLRKKAWDANSSSSASLRSSCSSKSVKNNGRSSKRCGRGVSPTKRPASPTGHRHSSFAANVNDWRPQTAPMHSVASVPHIHSPDDDVSASIREFEQRLYSVHLDVDSD